VENIKQSAVVTSDVPLYVDHPSIHAPRFCPGRKLGGSSGVAYGEDDLNPYASKSHSPRILPWEMSSTRHGFSSANPGLGRSALSDEFIVALHMGTRPSHMKTSGAPCLEQPGSEPCARPTETSHRFVATRRSPPAEVRNRRNMAHTFAIR
jgi:hypothetical protein